VVASATMCAIKKCFFVSDLHGKIERYLKLFSEILRDPPAAVFIGGDILPNVKSLLSVTSLCDDFLMSFFMDHFTRLQRLLKDRYPSVFVIFGNDDARAEEKCIMEGEKYGLWRYINNRIIPFEKFEVYGYCFVPPTPFLLKDWERYDVSGYVNPGSISPEEGIRTLEVDEYEARYANIKDDLDILIGENNLENAVFLFHSPPHQTNLDRVATDGRFIDYIPLDTHVGSIAIRQLIEERQPLLTLHGHIHESPRLTGYWHDRIGGTVCLSAAHDGPELSLIKFDLDNPGTAVRELL